MKRPHNLNSVSDFEDKQVVLKFCLFFFLPEGGYPTSKG